MFNLDFFRKNKKYIKENLKKRDFDCDIIYFEKLDLEIKKNKNKIYRIQYKHNTISLFVKILKKNTINFKYLISETNLIKIKINEIKKKINEQEKECYLFLSLIPNTINNEVPIGNNENDNLEIRLFNGINKEKDKFRNDIENSNDYIDFNLSAKLTGS